MKIIAFTETLRKQNRFLLANQLFKSGTSIGANIHEAQSPESKADFVHKMKIADKENRETAYWLMLCKKSDSLPDPGDLLAENEEIGKILSEIISTSKRFNNLNNGGN